jgi:hypothetical protein
LALICEAKISDDYFILFFFGWRAQSFGLFLFQLGIFIPPELPQQSSTGLASLAILSGSFVVVKWPALGYCAAVDVRL